MSTQKAAQHDDLNPSDLDDIFRNLTRASQDSDASVVVVDKKKNSHFVKNSGIVPYAS